MKLKGFFVLKTETGIETVSKLLKGLLSIEKYPLFISKRAAQQDPAGTPWYHKILLSMNFGMNNQNLTIGVVIGALQRKSFEIHRELNLVVPWCKHSVHISMKILSEIPGTQFIYSLYAKEEGYLRVDYSIEFNLCIPQHTL